MLSLENLLWSTRGREWGFKFVNIPMHHVDCWEIIYQNIFGRDDRVPRRWYGLIILQDGCKINYVASRFFDNNVKWKDIANREIPHELILEVDANCIENIISRDWEYSVMDQLRDFYRDAYDNEWDKIKTFNLKNIIIPLPSKINSIESVRKDIRFDAEVNGDKILNKFLTSNIFLR